MEPARHLDTSSKEQEYGKVKRRGESQAAVDKGETEFLEQPLTSLHAGFLTLTMQREAHLGTKSEVIPSSMAWGEPIPVTAPRSLGWKGPEEGALGV